MVRQFLFERVWQPIHETKFIKQLILTSQNPCARPFMLCFTDDELKNLANIGKIIRGNDEIYITTN